MRSSKLLVFLCLLVLPARADDVAFPEGWFTLAPDEAGLVFMLRSYGGDTGFDLVDEAGRIVDRLTLPKERTVIAQYRVPAGTYRVRFFDRDAKVKATPGLFAAFGGAVTHLPPAAGKPGTLVPDYAPFANYTPVAMENRVTPLAALGTTDFLPPKTLDAETVELRVSRRRD